MLFPALLHRKTGKSGFREADWPHITISYAKYITRQQSCGVVMNSSKASFKIFISHKLQDRNLALAIKNELSKYSEDLRFFLSSELSPGTDWASEIRSHLNEAHLMLLLFFDPSGDWDWCLYEAGLFAGPSGEGRPIVCIHSPDIQPPMALRSLKTVPATPDGLTVFVRSLYGGELTGELAPLNAAVAANKAIVRKLSERIASLFAARTPGAAAAEASKEPSKRGFREAELGLYCTHLFLTLHPSTLHNGEVPGDATVSSNNMEVFGLQKVPMGKDGWSWELFQANWISKPERLWLDDIGLLLQAAVDGRIPPQVTGTYREPNTHKVYRPILHRCVETPPDKITFQIVMAEQVGGVSTYSGDVDPSSVFVIASFREEMEPIFEGIEAAAKACGLSARRVKDVLGDYKVTDQLIAMLRQAQ